MNAIDKFFLGAIIFYLLISILLFFRLRGQGRSLRQFPWSTLGFGIVIPIMHIVANHEHAHPWLMWIEFGLPLICLIVFVGYSWWESNKAYDKAVREGRIRAVYNDWAKPDPE